MKIFFISTLCFALITNAYAEVRIADLPYLEGTPITAPQTDGTGWTLLDSAQINDVVQWAWLEHLGGKAYVIYPTDAPSITFPDGKTFNADSQEVSMYFIDVPSVEFTRFGGKVILEGKEVTARYSLNTDPSKGQNNTYTLTDHGVVKIAGFRSGTLSTTGTAQLIGSDNAANEIILGALSDSSAGCNQSATLTSSQQSTANNSLCVLPGGEAKWIEPLNFDGTLSMTVSPPQVITANIDATQMQTTSSKKSKGGSLDWVFLGAILLIALRKNSKSQQV